MTGGCRQITEITMHETKLTPPRRCVAMAVVLAMTLCTSAGLALAASADISTAPIDTAPSASIRPNVMFILDDSGSMAADYVPEEAGYFSNLCFGTASVNRIFYDPNKTYVPPSKADGTKYPNASFTNAPLDGFLSGSSRRTLARLDELSTPTTRVGTYWIFAVNSRYYYATYTGNGAPACSGGGYDWRDFDVVLDENDIKAPATVNPKTNYANWYAYYRTRMLTMRSSAGQVFAGLDPSRFRVGFSTITATSAADGKEFLNIRDFDSGSQRDNFFTRLYSQAGTTTTPLRSALAMAGKYYAGKLPGQIDPVQYSCQRNYAILSTDGYWNLGNEPKGWNQRLDSSSTIGNQDGPGGSVDRPQLDDLKSNGGTGGPGVSNTLADIAQYYYASDLRTPALGNCVGAVAGQDVCTNNVSPVPSDPAVHQHMNTITLGLGVSGTLAYDPNYLTQTQGDYYSIVNGTKAWPDVRPTDTTLNLPARIDDVWHAAVNGRGRYYSANDAAEVAASLQSSLDSIEAHVGSGSAAATSTLQPVTGDNFVFFASYLTKLWTGDLSAMTIDPVTGQVDPTILWSAATELAERVGATSDSRKIYFSTEGSNPSLETFTYANLKKEGLAAPFEHLCASGASRLSQCSNLTEAERTAASGANVVNYLRGWSGLEDAPANTLKVFRERLDDKGMRNVLGDIVNSVPVYVKKPPFGYVDDGYAVFANDNQARLGAVYTGANDGMLHAFNAETGAELWAYVPRLVMPDMHVLADEDYANRHQFLTDGAPTIGDIYAPSGRAGKKEWATILVAGLNRGGRGYYALDVTDPEAPRAMWEFTDTDLGYTYGNPIVTKLKNGTWVVLFSSGYNNIGGGNGNGHLYVLNARTGALISKIATFTTDGAPAGTKDYPSNLGSINGWVERTFDNTTERVYAGDMQGNLWRFDIDDNLGPDGNEALQMARATASDGSAQPITTKPELSEVKSGATRYPLISIGTGRLLGSSDLGDTQLQSIYTFKDTLSNVPMGPLRAHPGMVAQSLGAFTTNDGRAARTIASPEPVLWSSQAGWFVDLNLSVGERVNVDMTSQLGVLTVGTNIPEVNACTSGGSSWLYFFDVLSGSFVPTASQSMLSVFLGNTLVQGITTIQRVSGVTNTIVVNNRGQVSSEENPPPQSLIGEARRTSWRELKN